MDLRAVDPRDEGLLRDWHATYEQAQTHDRPYAVPWQLPELRAELLEPGRRRRLLPFAGVLNDDVVCSGALSLPQLDNLRSATVEVCTAPALRGRGHGSAMLAHLEALAARQGRSVINAEVSYPYDAATGADLEFATRRGYRVGLGDVMRVLDLPVDAGLLDAVATDAAPHHAAYELRSFTGPMPEDVVGSFAVLNAVLEVEAPTGELEREALTPDVDALREEERVRIAQGRTTITTLALRGDEVVAFTNLGTSVHEPDRAYQWGTLVARDHRGRRLGAAVKAANVRQLQRTHPAVRTIYTWNAEVNTHMVGINEALGFRPVERLAELQKRLSGPPPAPTPPAAPAS